LANEVFHFLQTLTRNVDQSGPLPWVLLLPILGRIG